MSTMKKLFGVPSEERSPEFYRENRWMGTTEAELHWQRTKRVVFLLHVVALVWGLTLLLGD